MSQPFEDQLEPSALCAKTEDGRGNLRYLTIGETVQASQAISLKRIADALDSSHDGGRPQGSVLWWLEVIATAAQNKG